MSPWRAPSRRGSIYIIVMFTTLIVVAMCLTGLDVQRAGARGGLVQRQAEVARSAARAGVELALQRTVAVPAWRTLAPSWTGTYTLDGASVTVTMTDPLDGTLSDDDSESVLVESYAVIGHARYRLQVTLDTFYPPLPSLRNALHSGGALSWNTAVFFATRTAGTNAAATATSSWITAPVEAVTSATGSVYRQATTAPAASRTLPGGSIPAYYTNNATVIPTGVLSLLGIILGGRKSSNFLLSAGDNPMGAENAQGLYILDLGGQNLELSDFRAQGTFILKNAGTVTLKGAVNWSPATPGFPALIVQGDLNIAVGSAPLSEAACDVNFNPAHTPYKGVSNSNKTDTFPSEINGLVFCTGALTISGQASIRGAVLARGATSVTGSATIVYDTVYETAAPPGFRDSPVMIVRKGSWTRIVD